MAFEMRVLALVFAVATQFQITLPVGDSGLRVAASDLFLPVGLLYFAIWFLSSRSRLEWRMPGAWVWLFALSAVMLAALIIGRVYQGNWSSWALVNKFAGWGALVGYFLVGSTFVRVGGEIQRDEFLTVFVVTAAATAALNVLAMPWLYPFYTLPFGIEFSRATGGMQNANAFGFLLVVAALLVLALRKYTHWLLPPLIAALWFSGSRGAMLAFGAGLLFMLILRSVRVRTLARNVAVSAIIVVCATVATLFGDQHSLARAESGASPIGFSYTTERFDTDAETVNDRREQIALSLRLFMEAPLFGHGLGYFLDQGGVTLHNSFLWLLVETGLIGACVFAAFLFAALYYLYVGRTDPFLMGMVAVSVAFMVMSATGEFLYQRHLWLLLGFALTRPGQLRERP